MEPRHHHLKSPVELFTHCFHHPSAFHDDNDHDNENCPAHQQQQEHRNRKRRNSIPAVTLFYDVDKNVTVAVLSQAAIAIEPLAVYLQSRVQQGTALERSILYYELEGYIRENYSKIQHCQAAASGDAAAGGGAGCIIGSEVIALAVGSLEASDEAQKKVLEEERRVAREQRSSSSSSSSSSSTTTTTVLEEEAEAQEQTLLMFEQAMEIARLHRLNDDLDVLSVYFLRQVNKTCGRIATRIAQYQLANCTTLVISPHVDGVALSGYSNFNRGTVIVTNNGTTTDEISDIVMNAPEEQEEEDPVNELHQQERHERRQRLQQSQHLVRHREFGRHIEYRRCKDILLTSTRRNPAIFSPNGNDSDGDDDETASFFTWDCEEVAFAVMHRWWGDIAEREYIGQKLVLSWLLRPSPSSSSSSSVASPTTAVISLPLGTIHLEPHSSKVKSGGGGAHGNHHQHHHQHFSISLASRLTLDILHSHTKVIDDVTVSYQGKARVCHVQVNFLALVRAAARHCLDSIQQDYLRIQESRPLLDHERDYLRRVQDAASL